MRKTIEAGLAVRKAIRRFLLEQDVDFVEDKGWFESTFYCKCSDEKYLYIAKSIEAWSKSISDKAKE